jgi:hypothetical protein
MRWTGRVAAWSAKVNAQWEGGMSPSACLASGATARISIKFIIEESFNFDSNYKNTG